MDKERYYTWEISICNENDIIIYEQEQENENSYICISHIIEQLLEENPQYKFHLKSDRYEKLKELYDLGLWTKLKFKELMEKYQMYV
tara:strand:- start:254 stop:514 length:261 start_codon:yes stop_codon:yes gene_type:complete